MGKFDVGEGSGWHIHYGHMKFGKNTKSRVEFNSRDANAIIAEIEDKVERWKLSTSGYFEDCIAWIRANY